MSVGRQIGEFSYQATSVTVSERADGAREHTINWEGTAAGYGTVVATMVVHLASAAATGGRFTWKAHAYLDSGAEADGVSDGFWNRCGKHQWRIRGINHVSDGAVLLSDGVIDLATRSVKGTLYAWE
jgi:hypothetical protein